jgi:hypothetical protein
MERINLRMLVVLIVTVFLMAGCEPKPGRVIDVKELVAGNLRVRLELRKEGRWGNPWSGQHFSIYCLVDIDGVQTSKNSHWKPVSTGYWLDGGLKSAPTNHVAVHDSGFFISDLNGGARFSFDGCRTLHDWDFRLPDRYQSVRAHPHLLGVVNDVQFCSGGTEISLSIDPRVFKDSRTVWATSIDAGSNWAYSEANRPVLGCRVGQVQTVSLGK